MIGRVEVFTQTGIVAPIKTAVRDGLHNAWDSLRFGLPLFTRACQSLSRLIVLSQNIIPMVLDGESRKCASHGSNIGIMHLSA